MKRKNFVFILLTIFCLAACGKTDGGTDGSGVSQTPSSMEAAAGMVNYELSIPDDFTETEVENTQFCYIGEDGSNINMNVQNKDPNFSAVTAALLNQSLTEAISQAYGEEVTITDHYFTTNTISGYPAYQYCLSYELQGTRISQLIVGIDADQTYTFTYTDMSGDWMDVFEKSAKTIRLTAE